MYIIKLDNEKILTKLFKNESDALDWLIDKESACGKVYKISSLSTWDLNRVLLMEENNYFEYI